MRMRKKKHGEQRIEKCAAFLAPSAEETMKDPQFPFKKRGELCLEIGCGKGAFAVGMAALHPEMNFYAMEKVRDVLVVALEKATAYTDADLSANLRFLNADADSLPELFPSGCFSRIYLNFSDPWPKKGHAKRRLTYVGRLNMYRRLLSPGGEIQLKTDNDGLFAFSLTQFEEAGFRCLWSTDDLHASRYADGNVMTEYERAFSEKGEKINAALFSVE